MRSLAQRWYFALVLGVALAIIYDTVSVHLERAAHPPSSLVLSSGELLGGDFVCFYTAGQLARGAVELLYDAPRFIEAQGKALPPGADNPRYIFAYPPFIAAVFSIFKGASYLGAYWSWIVCSVSIFAISLLVLTVHSKVHVMVRIVLLCCAAAFVPFSVFTLAGGQVAVIGVAGLALFWAFMQAGSPLLAGLALSLGLYKPPLIFALTLVLLLRSQWRVLAGFMLGGLILFSISLYWVGWSGLADFWTLASSYTYGQALPDGQRLPPLQGVGLLAILHMLFGSYPLIAWTVFIGLGLVLVISVVRLMESVGSAGFNSAEGKLALTWAMSVSVFLSVQVLKYDLSLLIVPAMVILPEVLGAGAFRGRCLLVGGAVGLWLFPVFSPLREVHMGLTGNQAAVGVWMLGLGAFLMANRRVCWTERRGAPPF